MGESVCVFMNWGCGQVSLPQKTDVSGWFQKEAWSFP